MKPTYIQVLIKKNKKNNAWIKLIFCNFFLKVEGLSFILMYCMFRYSTKTLAGKELRALQQGS